MADRGSAMSDQLLCVRNELTDLLMDGIPVPRFILATWSYMNFAGQARFDRLMPPPQTQITPPQWRLKASCW